MGMAVKLDFTEHVAPKIRFLADLGVHHHKVINKYDKQKFVLSKNQVMFS